MVGTREQAEAVQQVALELLRQRDARTVQRVAAALSWLPREQLALDMRSLAAHPDAGLRSLAAIRWAQDPASEPELGVELARDPDPRVRRLLAEALSENPAPPEAEPARETLRQDVRRSVRRRVQAG
jgi:HEAT repeat protein